MKKIFLLALVSALAVHGEAFAEETCTRSGNSEDCYNEQGQLVRTSYFKTDSSTVPYQISTTEYDTSGNRVSRTENWYNESDPETPYQRTVTEYDTYGNTVSSKSYSGTEASPYTKIEYKIDDNGKVLSADWYRNRQQIETNTPDFKYEWAYDENGKMVLYTAFEYIQYNSQGNMTEEHAYAYTCNGGRGSNCERTGERTDYVNTYVYNENGDLIEKYTDGVLVASYNPSDSHIDSDTDTNNDTNTNTNTNTNTDTDTDTNTNTSILEQNNADSSESVRLAKRIYTVKEATEASTKGSKNKFSIRHR